MQTQGRSVPGMSDPSHVQASSTSSQTGIDTKTMDDGQFELRGTEEMKPLDEELLSSLYRVLFEDVAKRKKDIEAWMDHGFVYSRVPGFTFGLEQTKGGPCGVLASVQAEIIKYLAFVRPRIQLDTPHRLPQSTPAANMETETSSSPSGADITNTTTSSAPLSSSEDVTLVAASSPMTDELTGDKPASSTILAPAPTSSLSSSTDASTDSAVSSAGMTEESGDNETKMTDTVPIKQISPVYKWSSVDDDKEANLLIRDDETYLEALVVALITILERCAPKPRGFTPPQSHGSSVTPLSSPSSSLPSITSMATITTPSGRTLALPFSPNTLITLVLASSPTDFVFAKLPADRALLMLLSNLHILGGSRGVLSFVLSALLSRGLDIVASDMDNEYEPMVARFGHTAQELVNLLITGAAGM